MRLLSIALSVLFILGCDAAVPAAAPTPPPLSDTAPKVPTATVEPEPTLTPIPTPTLTPIPTPTLVPTAVTATSTPTPAPIPTATPGTLMPVVPPSALTPIPMPTFPPTPTPAPVSAPVGEILFVFETQGFDISPTEPIGGVSTATRTVAYRANTEISVIVIEDADGEVLAATLRFPSDQLPAHDELIILSALMDAQLDIDWIFQVFEVNREEGRIINWGEYASPFIDIWVYPYIDENDKEFVSVEFIVKPRN